MARFSTPLFNPRIYYHTLMQLKNVPKNLPDSPGVYFFKKSWLHTPLYIGKATSLKDRVKSYFSKDLAETRGPHMAHMLKEGR